MPNELLISRIKNLQLMLKMKKDATPEVLVEAILSILTDLSTLSFPEKGDKGERGDQGLIGNPGVNGLNGNDGRNGENGRDGVDGLNGKDGMRGPIGETGQGTPGKDGSPDTAREIIAKLRTLKGKDGLTTDDIDGLEELIRKLTPPPPMGAYNGPSGIETPIKAGANVAVTRDTSGAIVISSTASAATLTTEPFTTAGGVQILTLAHTPISILQVIINGQPQNPTDYSNVGTALTLNLPDVPAGQWVSVLYTY